MKIYVKSAINPQIVALIAEIAGPIIVELIGKYWETHQDEVANDILDQSIDEISKDTSSDDNVMWLQSLLDEDNSEVISALQQLISELMSKAVGSLSSK